MTRKISITEIPDVMEDAVVFLVAATTLEWTSRVKKAASASLKKLGGDVTIRQVTAGAYNTTTGAISESTSDTTIKGALSNVSRNQVNDLIESQDKLLTISAGDLTFVPTTKDRVVISNVEFKIVQVITNEQNNTAVSFDLILR